MPEIIPIKELRNTNEISARAHAKNEPIFVTKNGYGDLVVMSVETYDLLLRTAEIDAAITEAENEINEEGGNLIEAKEALTKLRKKHFG